MSDKRKTIVLYGNCHIEAIGKMLIQSENFNEKYILEPTLPIYKIKTKEYFNNKIFRECDIFIHQSIQISNIYGKEYASENIIKLLKQDCIIISIPNVYHLPTCFFPQYYSENEFKRKDNVTIFFRDKLIDELYIKGYAIKNIQKEYIDENLYNEKKMKEDFSVFIEKIIKREQEWDIKVSEFILHNYKKSQLFFDPNHPTPHFLKYITKKCLEILDVKIADSEIKNMKEIKLDSYEMPICKSVKKCFGISYDNKIIRQSGIKLYNKEMDIKEYIKQYTAYEWQNSHIKGYLKYKSLLRFFVLYNKNIAKKCVNHLKRIFIQEEK